MNYTPSINIEHSSFDSQKYIITQNALNVVGSIVNSFESGIHSFNIIGSYGTGKSNFILALEDSLINNSNILIRNNGQFNKFKKFRFFKIVGDYMPLHNLLTNSLPFKNITNNIFDNLKELISSCTKKEEFVFIVIDEFGKLLEYASKNEPERELYFFQKFTEFINHQKRNAILLTTLHQNFNSYAHNLTESQRQEWNKVKGRFKEIVFNEPVEQLLQLASKRIDSNPRKQLNKDFDKLYHLAIKTNFASKSIDIATAKSLYPMDLFSAQALTLSIQRYGQNERTLFSFLEASGRGSLQDFTDTEHTTFNLANIYDYDIYNFHSYLSEVNSDSATWTGIKVSLERAESLFNGNDLKDASLLIKTIGMLNLFGNAGIKITKEDLSIYAKYALGIENAEETINSLNQHKIIRYAEYKSQYMLFEGTDVNIEGELLKASGVVPRSSDIVEKLLRNFNLPLEFANATYFKKGTPRYFEYVISNQPIKCQPINEIDGYINLIFNEDLSLNQLKEETADVEEAIIYAYFKQSDKVINNIWMLDKLTYIQNIIDSSDKVAHKEIKALIEYEKSLLNANVLNELYSYNDNIVWIYKGEEISINSKTHLNKWLSKNCDEIYYATPTFINELINKHKASSVMSLARINLLTHLLEYSSDSNLGFEQSKFPPEKTLFLTLLRKTEIHRKHLGYYELLEPKDSSFSILWKTCEDFLESSKEKPRKLGELINLLKSRPLKLKQGFIDLWLPVFLIIKKNDFSLYSDNGTFIPNINREVLDILQKNPTNYLVKAFNIDGVKLDLFNRYREIVKLNKDDEFTTSSLIDTIKPFLIFYNKLSNYAKHTKKLKKTTIQFRNVIAKAKDPEKTFFEDLPHALGFKDIDIINNDEVLKTYVDLLQNAIRDLRSCYAELINRIEKALISSLNLKSNEFSSYKIELENRYSCIKTYLLTDKQKTILTRITSNAIDKKNWYQSLAYVILDKQLENILDEEESYLIDNLIYSFKELEKYIDISNKGFESNDDFIRVELISNQGSISPQIIHLNEQKSDKATKLENKINKLLSGDNEIDAYALLNILKKKFKDEKS